MANKAKEMQRASEQPAKQESFIPVTVVDDLAFEHHLNLAESVLRGILDPETPDTFIEIPIPYGVQGVKHAYLHTSRIAKFYQHADFTQEGSGG